MFNNDFYPTPKNVIEKMGFDPSNKIVLEPSAGKGDIVDYCKSNGAKKILTFEKDEMLRDILKRKSIVMGDDFLKANGEKLSHIDMIVMNPPFSTAHVHILKAWEVAPEGCEIYALCNYETIAKDYRYTELNILVNDYGSAENLGNCFSNAERRTNVEVGLIKLVKPIISGTDDEWSGFFMDEEEEEENLDPGMIRYDEVRALVNRYVFTMKIFDDFQEKLQSLEYACSQIGMTSFSVTVGYRDNITTKEEFSKKLQKESWGHIFKRMNLEKFVTSGVMKNINKFVEEQEKIPFTMKNIYHMMNIIVGTREENLQKALIEAVDNFTKYTHENRFGVEGWKTNSGHMLNKKIIVEGIMETQSFMSFVPKYDSYGGQKINDLNKVLCNLTGQDYNKIGDVYYLNKIYRDIKPNTWYDWGFFDIKMFKKGTMHLKFKRVEDWYILNLTYGKLKGFSLPETYKK